MNLIQSLKDAVRCTVSVNPDKEYRDAIQIDNGRILRSPMAIVHARTVTDIVSTINFARNRGLLLTAKAGGHSYAGYCLNDQGIVLDLAALQKVSFGSNPDTLVVQMGCKWLDVYTFLATNSPHLIAVGGTCLGVGVSGFILGGGYSFLSRSYGLGSDSVEDLSIVTADGVLRQVHSEAPSSDDRDLWWACLGSGGGNYGIVTEATLRLHRLPSTRLMGGWVEFSIDQLEEVLRFYNRWVNEIPEALSVYGYIGRLPDPASPSSSPLRLRLQPVYNGNYSDGMKLLQPLLQLKPVASRFVNVSLLEYLHMCSECTAVAGRQSYMRSGLLPQGSITDDVVALLRRFMESAPSEESFMLWMHQGGASSRIDAVSTAFWHRRTQFVYEVVAVWRENSAASRNVEWAYSFGESLRPHFTGAYVNYMDPLLRDWANMYHGLNYSKLVAIKNRWDPGNLFRFLQSIGSPYEPTYSNGPNLSLLNRVI